MIARFLLIPLVAPLLASCMSAEDPPYTSADSEARLAQHLAGKVAGAPVDCLPYSSTSNLEVIDRDTLLYDFGGTTYRQDADGHCYPTDSQSGYTLVTTGFGSTGRLCNGDLARVVSSASGFIAGSCTFNKFVPYRRP